MTETEQIFADSNRIDAFDAIGHKHEGSAITGAMMSIAQLFSRD